jgi:Ras-related protein Rab-1A
MDKHKLILLGDTTVGKTSIANRLHNKQFTPVDTTVGSEFSTLKLDGYHYMIWDTAGQERYRSLTDLYFKDAHIVLLVFDVSDLKSLAVVEHYKELIDRTLTKGTYALITIGNKTDLVGQPELDNLQMDLQTEFPATVFTSAKTDDGMDRLLQHIVSQTQVLTPQPPTRKPTRLTDSMNRIDPEDYYIKRCGCNI